MAARKEVARNRRVVARTRSTRRSSPGAVVVLSRERNRCGSTVRRKRIPHLAVQSYRYSTGHDGKEQSALLVISGDLSHALGTRFGMRTRPTVALARPKSKEFVFL